MTVTRSIAVGEALLILKILFLLLLYLFIWRIVRTASRDLRLPQESFVLDAGPGAGGRPDRRRRSHQDRAPRRLRTVSSARLDSTPTVYIGRDQQNDIALDDDYASTRHARLEPRRDGVWVSDAGSTNGTFVNGVKLEKRAGSRPAT